jgi:hypothetical protein
MFLVLILQNRLSFYLFSPLASFFSTALNRFSAFSIPSFPNTVFHIGQESSIHNGCESKSQPLGVQVLCFL